MVKRVGGLYFHDESTWNDGNRVDTGPRRTRDPESGRNREDGPVTSSASEEAPDRADAESREDETAHLNDVPDGSGCTEIWEHLSERRERDGGGGADDEPEP